MWQHINTVVGLPQTNCLDDFGLLFDTGAFCLGVDYQVSYIHVERNRKLTFIISDECGIVHASYGLALISVLFNPKRKEMKQHGRSRRILTALEYIPFLISPRLSFGKSLAEKGVELQRHCFLFCFFRCESHSILDSLGVDFLFLLSFSYVLFLHILFTSLFLCSIFTLATRRHFS